MFFYMKRFFGLLLMVIMFVGISTATPSTSTKMVIDQTHFVIPQATLSSGTVLTAIDQWVGDNFSSEVGSDALMPSTMEYSTVNYDTGTLWLYGKLPFDIEFTLNETDNTLSLVLYDKQKPITSADKQKASAVISKFTTDFKSMLDKMPQ